MKDKILLLLGILDAEDAGVALEKTSSGLDVKVKPDGGEGNVIETAFDYAEATSKELVVLQILTSDLYHYGYNDLILPGGAKTRFLSYVQAEVLKRGMERAKELEEMARKRGISLEMHSVEADDPVSAAVEEAGKGYKVIFLPLEKKRLFPIFQKTVAQHLKQEVCNPVISC